MAKKSTIRAKYGITKVHEDRQGWDIAAPPCDTCAKRQFCKEGKFACKDFDLYTSTNKDQNISKRPSQIVYRRIFQC